MFYKKSVILFMCCFLTVFCDDINNDKSQQSTTSTSSADDTVEQIYEECNTNIDCAEKKFVAIIDRVDQNDNLEIIDGVKIIKKQDVQNHENLTQPKKDEGLLERATRYLAEHELKIEAPQILQKTARAIAADPRRRKIRKILMPMLLLLKLKAIIIIPIVLTVIGLIALKGLGAAMAALMLSGFTALKNILDGKQTTEKRITFGLIPPYVAHEPHWSRTGPTSLDYAELDPYYRTLPRGQ